MIQTFNPTMNFVKFVFVTVILITSVTLVIEKVVEKVRAYFPIYMTTSPIYVLIF
jgi:hypothetical protein